MFQTLRIFNNYSPKWRWIVLGLSPRSEPISMREKCYSLVWCVVKIFIFNQIFSLARFIQEYSPAFKTARDAKNIRRIINTITSIWLWKYARTCRIFVLGHYLFLKAQFCLSYAPGKLFASRNRQCPRTYILAHFLDKWRPLFTYLYF